MSEVTIAGVQRGSCLGAPQKTFQFRAAVPVSEGVRKAQAPPWPNQLISRSHPALTFKVHDTINTQMTSYFRTAAEGPPNQFS